MRVLLINPLSQPSYWENDIAAKWPPLGLCYLAAVLEKEGHQVKILERRLLSGVRKRTPEQLAWVDKQMLKELAEFRPELVGITATTPLIMDAYATAKAIKGLDSSIKIIIGGPHPTAEPELCLEECPAVDIVCKGEGELTMLDLADKKPLAEIEGIFHRQGKEIKATPARAVWPNLDELPYPAYHLLDKDFYFKPTSVLIRGFHLVGTTILAARGCPFTCKFCQSSQIVRSNKGRFLRFHSPQYVVGNIKYLIDNFGVEGILFAEDIFSIDRDNMIKICRLLIEEGLNKKIKFAINLRVDTIDQELLKLFRQAGCVRAVYGHESGSDRVLGLMNKRTSRAQNLASVQMTKAAGITCESSILVGLPGEKKEDFLQTISFLKTAKPDRVIRSKFFPIPGSVFYDELLRQKKITKPKDWNELSDKYTLNDFTFAQMTPLEFRRLYAKMDREATLPINYCFAIKTNLRRHPLVALRNLLLMIIHRAILYLPLRVQDVVKKTAFLLRIKSKFVFR